MEVLAISSDRNPTPRRATMADLHRLGLGIRPDFDAAVANAMSAIAAEDLL